MLVLGASESSDDSPDLTPGHWHRLLGATLAAGSVPPLPPRREKKTSQLYPVSAAHDLVGREVLMLENNFNNLITGLNDGSIHDSADWKLSNKHHGLVPEDDE